MILTVTLNPLLERRFIYNRIKINAENRYGKIILKAGGKGINVSRQLNRLGIQTIALTFTGGTNGKLLKEILRNEGIHFSNVQTSEETREAAIIIETDETKLSTFFSENFSVSQSERDSFISKMEKMISNCEIVVFAGSSPCETTHDVFIKGIEIANKLDKVSICDTYGSHLVSCLEASPTVIHNNVKEINSSLNISLKTESEKLSLLDYLYSKGIKQTFITDGPKSFYSSNFDFHYKVTVPEITAADSTGSGDSFIAGLAYGWHNKLTFEQQLVFAAALGVCNAKAFETSEVEKADAINMSRNIYFEPAGKKLRLINDKPD
jgi:1-phosphofructokinase family hexose kinase